MLRDSTASTNLRYMNKFTKNKDININKWKIEVQEPSLAKKQKGE